MSMIINECLTLIDHESLFLIQIYLRAKVRALLSPPLSTSTSNCLEKYAVSGITKELGASGKLWLMGTWTKASLIEQPIEAKDSLNNGMLRRMVATYVGMVDECYKATNTSLPRTQIIILDAGFGCTLGTKVTI